MNSLRIMHGCFLNQSPQETVMSGSSVPSSLGTFENKSESIWKAIELEMRQQQNPEKMVQLWKELDQALLEEERRKVQQRLAQSRQKLTVA
jgi:hypothetical protein